MQTKWWCKKCHRELTFEDVKALKCRTCSEPLPTKTVQLNPGDEADTDWTKPKLIDEAGTRSDEVATIDARSSFTISYDRGKQIQSVLLDHLEELEADLVDPACPPDDRERRQEAFDYVTKLAKEFD